LFYRAGWDDIDVSSREESVGESVVAAVRYIFNGSESDNDLLPGPKDSESRPFVVPLEELMAGAGAIALSQ